MPALPVTVIFVVNAVAALGSTSLEPLSNTYVLQWATQLFVKSDIISMLQKCGKKCCVGLHTIFKSKHPNNAVMCEET